MEKLNNGDFRTGNYVMCLGKISKIEGISNRLRPDCGYFEIEGVTNPLKGIHIEPIPLTEYILLNNCSFELMEGKLGDFFIKDNIILNYFRNSYSINITVIIDDIEVEFLHDLQNIYYYKSKKKELTIKL